jgi:amino acid permease
MASPEFELSSSFSSGSAGKSLQGFWSSADTSMDTSLQTFPSSDEHGIPAALHVPSPSKHKNSILFSGFLLLNSMIGSGILNQPQVFQQSGIIAALILFGIASYFTWLGLVVLIESGAKVEKYDFSLLAKHCYPRWGEKAVDASIIIGNFGALLSYIDIVGATSSELLFSWSCSNTAGCGPYLITVLLLLFICLPFCLYRVFGHLSYISAFSMIAIGSILSLVIIGGPIVGGNAGPYTVASRGAGSQLGSIIFTLSCSFASFLTFKSMDNPTPAAWKRVSTVTVWSGFLLCAIMGIAGYLSFGANTEGIILSNFTGHYADFFKVLLVVHLTLYIPIDFVSMRHCTVKFYGIESGNIDSLSLHIIWTFVLLAIPTLVMLMLRYAGFSSGEAFSFVLDFSGGLAGSLTSFVFPAAFYLKLNDKMSEYYYHCVVMLVFGSIFTVVIPVLSIVSLTTGGGG